MLSEADRNLLTGSDLAYLHELTKTEFRQMCADANTSVPVTPKTNEDRIASYLMSTPARLRTVTWDAGDVHVQVTPKQRRRLFQNAGPEARARNAA